MNNPKTSASGIACLVTGVTYLLVAWMNHTPVTAEGVSMAITSIATGIGLVAARDASQSAQVVDELKARLEQLEAQQGKGVDKAPSAGPPSQP